MVWNAVVAVKCNGKLNDTHWETVKAWSSVKSVWSSMGDWDFWMLFDNSVNDQDKLEEAIFKLRQQDWISDTETSWWKEV